MSARDLARELALQMADGRPCLPRLTCEASPEFARDLLEAFYRLRDTLAEDRKENGQSWPLRERIAAASVAQEIDGAIADARAWLSRVARRGGRGIPASPAPEPVSGIRGASGCRGGAPAVEGHGCPALAPAVGPAPAISESHATAHPADPLFLGQPMQELPVAGVVNPSDITCAKELSA